MAGGIDIGALFRKLAGDQSADVLPGLDNVSLNKNTLAAGGLVSAIQGTDANAPGGSKYVAPAAPTTPIATAPSGGVLGDTTTAPGGTATPLNTGLVNNTQIAIDQLPSLLQSALQNEAQSHANTVAGYDASQATQQKTYDDSTTTNQQNYDGNYMDSIRAGIKGLGSLVNLLRGTGAAGGTAEDLVRDTVGGVTADDIRSGADTQKTNQSSLDGSLASFLTDLKGKRAVADDTFTNNQAAINRDSQTQMQDLLTKMAGYYGDAGQTAKANQILGQAGALTPGIAANSKTVTSAYDQTPVAVQAPQLTAFSAPSQPDVATAPTDGQVGSGIFTMTKKKDTSNTPQLATVGA